MLRETILKETVDIAIVGGSSSLFIRGLSDKEPKDLDLLCTRENLKSLKRVLAKLGGMHMFSITNLRGFHPSSQYHFKEFKVDIFTVPENIPHSWVGDNKYVEPQVVWAARAFYAAKGWEKAKQQLVDSGFWLQEQSDNAQNEQRDFDDYGDEDNDSFIVTDDMIGF